MDIPARKPLDAQAVVRCEQALLDRVEALRAGYEKRAGLPVKASEVLRVALSAGVGLLERRAAREPAPKRRR